MTPGLEPESGAVCAAERTLGQPGAAAGFVPPASCTPAPLREGERGCRSCAVAGPACGVRNARNGYFSV